MALAVSCRDAAWLGCFGMAFWLSSARRPASVILTRTTSIVLPPAFTTSRSAAASLRRTRPANIRQLKPWPRTSSSSLAPCRLLASNSSARRCSALRLVAAFRRAVTALDPIRSRWVALCSMAGGWSAKKIPSRTTMSSLVAAWDASSWRPSSPPAHANVGIALIQRGTAHRLPPSRPSLPPGCHPPASDSPAQARSGGRRQPSSFAKGARPGRASLFNVEEELRGRGAISLRRCREADRQLGPSMLCHSD
jgi:hypothetical protein